MSVRSCWGSFVAGVFAFAFVTGCSDGSGPAIDTFIGNPDGVLEFLYPDGVVEPGTSPVAVEYIRDTVWDNNGFASLARVLDEAATAHRDPADPKAELSALAATDTINLLGQRGVIAATADDHLGHLLANYIIDIDGHVNATTADTLAQLGPTFDDLPPSAEFNPDALDTVLTQTLNSPSAIRQVTNAALQLNANRTAAAVRAGAEVSYVRAGADENNELIHYVIARAGLEDQSEPNDSTTAMITELRDAQNLLPSPDARFADYLRGQSIAKTRSPPLESFLDESVFEHPKRLDGPRGIARQALYIATGIQMGEAGLLKNANIVDETYPWIVDGSFDARLALERDNAASFFDSLKHDPTWGTTFGDLLTEQDTG